MSSQAQNLSVRLSVGIEDVEDIKADIDQALQKAATAKRLPTKTKSNT